MTIQNIYKKQVEELIVERGSTKFHITGIRHCDFKESADDFIRVAARRMQGIILMPEDTNSYDTQAVVCYSGNKRIGYVSIPDLEKYYILAGKDETDHLTGHFNRFNTEKHLRDLSVPGTVLWDDIYAYRKERNKEKEAQYGSWKYDAIRRCLLHSRHQDDAKACLSQMKEFTVSLFGGLGSTTREELCSLLESYKESGLYDISLEGQRERWDILFYLDFLYVSHHRPGTINDPYFEEILLDVISQIGGELGRSVAYTSYIGPITELVTRHLPSSSKAQRYMKTLTAEVIHNIRQQVAAFPFHLYRLFRDDPEEFVKTLYYARIPRKYLDPFLSGIALVEAYDRLKGTQPGESLPPQPSENAARPPYFSQSIFDELMNLAGKGDWADGITPEEIRQMLASVLGAGEPLSGGQAERSARLWKMLTRGRGDDRVRIVWQNLIGYFAGKRLLVDKSSPQLNEDFFGNKIGSDNINKGRNNDRMSKISPLLDAYLPKKDMKKAI